MKENNVTEALKKNGVEFYCGYGIRQINYKSGIVRESDGKEIVPCKWNHIAIVEQTIINKIFFLVYDSKCGLLDENGEEILSPNFTRKEAMDYINNLVFEHLIDKS